FFCVFSRDPCSSLFPYTTLFRSIERGRQAVRGLAGALEILLRGNIGHCAEGRVLFATEDWRKNLVPFARIRPLALLQILLIEPLDRKSTRLNSSHGSISYAVFCL